MLDVLLVARRVYSHSLMFYWSQGVRTVAPALQKLTKLEAFELKYPGLNQMKVGH